MTRKPKRQPADALRETHPTVRRRGGSLARAEETLPDRQRFSLDVERWAAFQSALDAPARPNRRLKKLLQKPSVFEHRRK